MNNKPFECPDGISVQGVWMPAPNPGATECQRWSSGIIAHGIQQCSHVKMTNGKVKPVWPYQSDAGSTICGKAVVKHGHVMSKQAGMLMMKRVTCVKQSETGVFECSVFKAGLCVDVLQDIWSNKYTDQLDKPIEEAQRFAAAVEKILAENGDVLPARHQCDPWDSRLARENIALF